MAQDEDPLDLSIEDLLMEEELESAVVEKLSPSALFDRPSVRQNRGTGTTQDAENARHARGQAPGDAPPFLKPRSGQPARKLSADVDRDALASRIEQELIEEFDRIIPKLMDEALDHMVERLPVIINRKLTTHMLDYLLENRERILRESIRKRGS